MSDADLLALIERLRFAAADRLATRHVDGAAAGETGMRLEASLANDAAMAVNELLALRQILRVTNALDERGTEPLH